MPWRRVARWAAWVVLLVCVPFFTADRLEQAYDPHWWTDAVRFMPLNLATVLYVRSRTRPDGPSRWSWLSGWRRPASTPET